MISMHSYVVIVAVVTVMITLVVSSVAVYVLLPDDSREEFDDTLQRPQNNDKCSW